MTELRDEPETVTVLRRRTVHAGRIWDVVSDDLDFRGEQLTRDYIQHPGAVAVVALDDRGRVMLLQQYRHPVGMRDWEIPAGLRDVAGEDPVHTAARELAEEADLVAERWTSLGEVLQSPGSSSERIVIFLAEGLSPAESTYLREGEEADMRHEWLDLETAVQAVARGQMRNALTAMGLFLAREAVRGRAA